jgi:hypothetical protein
MMQIAKTRFFDRESPDPSIHQRRRERRACVVLFSPAAGYKSRANWVFDGGYTAR